MKTINASQIRQGDRLVTFGPVTVTKVAVQNGIVALTVRHPRLGVVPMSFRPNERITVKES